MPSHRTPDRMGDIPAIGRPATNALIAAGITTLADLATLPKREVLAMHGIGPKAVAILEDALAARRMSFAP